MASRTTVPFQAGPHVAAAGVDDFRPHVGGVLWAISGVVGLGSLLDLGILWLRQREGSPQWEFMAVSNTLDAIPTLVLALGAAYLGLLLRRPESALGYRLLACLLMLVGLLSALLGALLVTDYFSLSQVLTPESRDLLRSTTLKGLLLSGLFFFLLVPTGLLGVLRPRARR